MLYLPSFVLSFQWKHLSNFLDNRVDSVWKDIENLRINELILKCVMMSNLSMQHRMLKELVTFRYMKIGFLVLRKILPIDVDSSKFLWLSTKVKHF